MTAIAIKKKNVDISKVGVSPERGKMTLDVFKKWCNSHGFTGDLEKAHAALQPKAKEVKK